MKFVVFIVVLIAAAIGFIYSGLYNVAASEPHSNITRWVMHTTAEQSVARHSENLIAPPLSDPQLAQTGAGLYDGMCVFCHGAPGAEPTPLARGLNPKPPQLFEEEGHYKAPELFWIIKNGIKLSGMPAWGGSHSDDELWAIVAFLQQLPQLSATEYQSMTAEAHDEAGSHENPAARDTSETHSN